METEPEVVVLDFLNVQPVKADRKKKVLCDNCVGGSVCPQQKCKDIKNLYENLPMCTCACGGGSAS